MGGHAVPKSLLPDAVRVGRRRLRYLFRSSVVRLCSGASHYEVRDRLLQAGCSGELADWLIGIMSEAVQMLPTSIRLNADEELPTTSEVIARFIYSCAVLFLTVVVTYAVLQTDQWWLGLVAIPILGLVMLLGLLRCAFSLREVTECYLDWRDQRGLPRHEDRE